jgi:hypothetical protein
MATTITAKGDLLVGTGSATYDNLAVGTDGYTLVADSAETTGLKWAAPAGGGKMLQVVAGTGASTFQGIKTASATDITNMSVTITPSSTNSKILIFGQLNGCSSQNATNREFMTLRLVDGSNNSLYVPYSFNLWPDSAPNGYLNIPFSYIHSPNTTSAFTYKLRVTNDTSTYGIYVNNQLSVSIVSSITAMEIGA